VLAWEIKSAALTGPALHLELIVHHLGRLVVTVNLCVETAAGRLTLGIPVARPQTVKRTCSVASIPSVVEMAAVPTIGYAHLQVDVSRSPPLSPKSAILSPTHAS
jgi:hypothetical protein